MPNQCSAEGGFARELKALRADWRSLRRRWSSTGGRAAVFRLASLAVFSVLPGSPLILGSVGFALSAQAGLWKNASGCILAVVLLTPPFAWVAIHFCVALGDSFGVRDALADKLSAHRAATAKAASAPATAGRAKTEPPPQPEAAPEAPAPRPWYRPEPPPGATLGPRRIEDNDPPPSS